MNIFKKTKDRLIQTVSSLTDRAPTDADLAASFKKLEILESMIASLKSKVTGYADSMLAMAETSHRLAAEVSQFYRKSESRQKSVALFTNAQSDQESNILFLFKEQLGWDVLRELDTWVESLHVLRERIRSIDSQISNNAPSTAEANALKAPVIAEVTKMVDGRFSRFDRVFVRLLEFQRDFFTDGLEVTDQFGPVVEAYRKKVPLPSNSGPSPKLAAAKSPAADPERKPTASPTVTAAVAPSPTSTASATKSTPKVVPTMPSNPVLDDVDDAPTTSTSTSTATARAPATSPESKVSSPAPSSTPTVDLFGSFASASASASAAASPLPTPAPAASPSHVNLFDIDFSEQPKAAPAKPSVPQTDLFGGLFDAPAAAPAPKAAPAPTAGFDILGMDAFDRPATKTQPKPATSASVSGSARNAQSADFDPTAFFSASSPAPTRTQPSSYTSASASTFSARPLASPASSSIDDIDDDVASPAPASSAPAATRSGGLDDDFMSFSSPASPASAKATTFDSFDPLASSFTAPRATAKANDDIVVQNIPTGPQLTESEEKEAITNIKLQLEARVEAWRCKHGSEKNIQALLSSLHTILWEGNTWKKVDTTQLLDYNSVKKAFRRALLTVHPDKVSNGTPEMKATADLVFEILNMSFKQYEVSLGMRAQ